MTTSIETIRLKVYPVDTNSFCLSITNLIETPQSLTQSRLKDDVILDEFLVSKETCTDHLTSLLSCLFMEPSTQDYLVGGISTQAILWKNNVYAKKGRKIEVDIKRNVEYGKRDGETGLTELSSALSRIDLNSDDSDDMAQMIFANVKISREEIKGCILDKQIYAGQMKIESYSTESKGFFYSVTYESTPEISHENVDGHKINVTVRRPVPLKKEESAFPEQIVMSQDTYDLHNTQISASLSKLNLQKDVEATIFHYLSRAAHLWNCGNGDGILHDITLKYIMDTSFEVNCEDSCSLRIVETNMAERRACTICQKGLSVKPSCMELPCSHRFHEKCLMKWLKIQSTCPNCRKDAADQVATLFF